MCQSSRVSHPNDDNLIQSTCNKTPHPNLCLQTLNSNPNSKTTDVKGLALIMVDSIKSKSNNTLNKVVQLIIGTDDDKIRFALFTCRDSYTGILMGDVPQATQALKSGNPSYAEEATFDSISQANFCDSIQW
ncbi:hypothetical protein PIB30_030475 [Stylosanthes scabra]|uniref:Pectinesterase inhibitor domain-containing protein n=1 Tax=Stylosanthes scabra TaxID=79078 RepID=A0ABU6UAD1_9FABA|nr:hypothetical protein [Stylosanthes scabra]